MQSAARILGNLYSPAPKKKKTANPSQATNNLIIKTDAQFEETLNNLSQKEKLLEKKQAIQNDIDYCDLAIQKYEDSIKGYASLKDVYQQLKASSSSDVQSEKLSKNKIYQSLNAKEDAFIKNFDKLQQALVRLNQRKQEFQEDLEQVEKELATLNVHVSSRSQAYTQLKAWYDAKKNPQEERHAFPAHLNWSSGSSLLNKLQPSPGNVEKPILKR